MEDLFKKREAYFNSFEKKFAERLCQLIRRRHAIIISRVNAELITFFWKTGRELNRAIKANSETWDSNVFFRKISPGLVSQYGDFFTEKSLKSMVLFFEKYPDIHIVEAYMHLLSWEHMVVLLEINDNKERQFYLQLKIAHGLSLDELKTEINADAYRILQPAADNKRKVNDRSLRRIQTSFDWIAIKDDAITNPFKKPLLAAFQSLTEWSSGNGEKSTLKDSWSVDPENEWLQAISNLIHGYRLQQNTQLNTNVNVTFWEIGREINAQFDFNRNEASGIDDLVCQTSAELSQKFDINISQTQLKGMCDFANRFKEGSVILPVAYFLEWRFIRELLPLDSINDINYYLKKLALEETSLKALQELIKIKSHKENLPENHTQHNAFWELSTVTTTTEAGEHGTVTITNIDLNVDKAGNRLINPLVFEDQEISHFLTLF